MLDTSHFETVTVEDQRIGELEARVRWLEGALTSVLQSRHAPLPASGEAVLLAAAGQMAGGLLKTQRLSVATTPGAQSADPGSAPACAAPRDAMSFTSAFSTLDARLQEQAEMEAAATERHPKDMMPPVLIDEALIDRAFARPAPEKIEVCSHLEECYPHLLERIVATWRSPESQAYLRKLIVDERGSRQGFPFDVMSELLMLSAVVETPESRQWGEDGVVR